MPRHGEEHPTFLLGGGDNANLVGNTTAYYHVNGGVDRVGFALVEIRVPFDCVISELRGNSNAAPGAGETFTYTLMVEGIATALTCQTVNPNIESNDLVNEINVDEDDRICLRIVTSLAAAVVTHMWSMQVVKR